MLKLKAVITNKMNKIGKIGRANQKARAIIAQMCEEMGLDSCEVGLSGCMGTFGVAPAHKRKRVFYNGDVELLSDYRQWICMCIHCHNLTEVDRELNEEIFNKLRP